ncbi:MAG: carboxylate--amine ligase, partial [Paludibacteraceae bacterium]|nr:carboxylate--amine ligase [Paludibacteraceae bacterium]
SKDQLEDAVVFALEYSISHEFIIEEWIEKVGCSSDSDCFSLNGQFQMLTYSAQRIDENAVNPYAPAADSWPSTMGEKVENKLSLELQRLISLLGMMSSIYNVETRLGTDGKPYIMEVSPRGGGNRLAEVVRYATGVDMITNAVRGALGMPIEEIGSWEYSGHWAEIMLHSYSNGAFQSLDINEDVRPYVRDLSLWVKEGDMIHKFESARYAIGSCILRFDNKEDMEYAITHQSEWLKVNVK